MPDPAARDPHTPIFDKNGILWFTLQSSNMVGRLNPKTGEIKLATAPTPRSIPTAWSSIRRARRFVQFGVNKVASIDPNTMAIKEYPLPNPVAPAPTRDHQRRCDLVRGLLAWLSWPFRSEDWRREGMASRRAAALPAYGITALNDVIWYSESAVRPNTLVRFDPKTEKFQTWAIPSGGGVVRNMMATTDGNGLVLACSGGNRVRWRRSTGLTDSRFSSWIWPA